MTDGERALIADFVNHRFRQCENLEYLTEEIIMALTDPGLLRSISVFLPILKKEITGWTERFCSISKELKKPFKKPE